MGDCDLPLTKNFSTLHKYDTEFSADSVEWCPFDPYKNFFVCGLYQLEEKEETKGNSTGKRIGKILLFSLEPDGLKHHQTIETDAILDQKWCPKKISNNILLGVVDATGSLHTYKLQDGQLHCSMTLQVPQRGDSEVLLLSLDWSCAKYESQEPYIACSDSRGDVHIVQLNGDELTVENSWHGHEFQAWITGFYYWDHNVFFSGGDDSLFLQYDFRCPDGPVARNRQHKSGVTAFHSNISREHVVVTGSYDDHVRLWDIRNIKQPTDSLKMPGSLWRLKWDPFSQKCLLAACMLGGVHVIDSKTVDIVDSYYEHKNISYGADWSHMREGELEKYGLEGNVVVGSCSFYDKLLCVSEVKLEFE